jgi:hypothetical protein
MTPPTPIEKRAEEYLSNHHEAFTTIMSGFATKESIGLLEPLATLAKEEHAWTMLRHINLCIEELKK